MDVLFLRTGGTGRTIDYPQLSIYTRHCTTSNIACKLDGQREGYSIAGLHRPLGIHSFQREKECKSVESLITSIIEVPIASHAFVTSRASLCFMMDEHAVSSAALAMEQSTWALLAPDRFLFSCAAVRLQMSFSQAGSRAVTCAVAYQKTHSNGLARRFLDLIEERRGAPSPKRSVPRFDDCPRNGPLS